MQAAIGRNLSTAALIASCPSRNYEKCYYRTIEARYPVAKFRTRRPPGLKKGVCEPADDPNCRPIGPDRVVEWFGGTELPSPSSCPAQPSPPPLAIDCRQPPSAAQQQQLLLLVGVPSSPTATGTKRRAAIRDGWMRDERVGRQVAVCFLLSSLTPQPQLAALQAEAAEHKDMLLLDAPETGMLLRNNTRYSGYSKKGRGMPTFKQYRFFQHAAEHWAAAPFVAKFDDDTAPSLRLLLPLLASLHPRCEASPKLAFIGAVNWAGVVPRAEDSGVRLDRCGFGWGLRASLHNYGASFGTKGSPGYIEACDLRGAALPLPYATGAGYIFSQALLHWVATDPQVVGWVAEASGPEREALQWQKFEDTSTAYWLTYSPATVQYVDIGPLIHDAACHVDGARKRARDGTYRCALAAPPLAATPLAATRSGNPVAAACTGAPLAPTPLAHSPTHPPTTDAAPSRRRRPPSNSSLLVHNLKTPTAFSYAWRHMRGDTLPYDHAECELEVRGRRVAAGAALPKRGRGGGSKARGRRGGKGNGLQGRRGKRGGGRGPARKGRGAGGDADDDSDLPQLFQLVLAAGKAADQATLMRQQNTHLQSVLRTRGLATHGGKKALVARLIGSYRSPQLSTHR